MTNERVLIKIDTTKSPIANKIIISAIKIHKTCVSDERSEEVKF